MVLIQTPKAVGKIYNKCISCLEGNQDRLEQKDGEEISDGGLQEKRDLIENTSLGEINHKSE